MRHNNAINRAVNGIFDELCGRKGFDLRSLDREIQSEIKQEWRKIVQIAYDAGFRAGARSEQGGCF